MCKIYEFPVKKELPEDIVKGLQIFAKEYVNMINNSLDMLTTPETTAEEYTELSALVLETYLDAVMKAVENNE